MHNTFSQSGSDSKWFLKKIILNFHFDYLTFVDLWPPLCCCLKNICFALFLWRNIFTEDISLKQIKLCSFDRSKSSYDGRIACNRVNCLIVAQSVAIYGFFSSTSRDLAARNFGAQIFLRICIILRSILNWGHVYFAILEQNRIQMFQMTFPSKCSICLIYILVGFTLSVVIDNLLNFQIF